jgi:TRAP-type mannitol/chloroaromatic compound transport system permease large subunit
MAQLKSASMAEMIAQNLAPIMFVSLVLVLLLGYPVAFSLAAVGMVFFIIGVELAPYSEGVITLTWTLLQSMPLRVFQVMKNDTLLAIPFFTFMGLILERSGMAEDLLETVGQLFGTVRGGLAYAVVFVGALLAATTGVVAASVISMGLISLPIMLRYGYDRRLASGVIAASGTLAQIIPPSLVLIVMADQLGRSVDDMYKGALAPGLLLAGFYALYVFILSRLSPSSAPGLPLESVEYRDETGSRGLTSLCVVAVLSSVTGYWIAQQSGYSGIDLGIVGLAAGISVALVLALISRAFSMLTGRSLLSPLAEQVTFVMVPPLLLIFLVLGTILIGLATPTEGGAMGAVGAMILAMIKRRLSGNAQRFNWQVVRTAAEATAKLSAFVLFILIGARIFSLTFYGVNGHLWVEHLLTSTPGGMYGFLILINIAVFFLSFFLDFFELAFIIVPLLKPVAEAIFTSSPEAVAIAESLGFAVITTTGADGEIVKTIADLTPFIIWFGVLLSINMQTSFMHPPFGFALFYLRSVAPKSAYKDRLTGEEIAPVTTGQIYRGAIPFLCIQLFMVAMVLLFPVLVMGRGDTGATMGAGVGASGHDSGMALRGEKFALPPTPPAIEGAPNVPLTGPGAPTLDLRVPPEFD